MVSSYFEAGSLKKAEASPSMVLLSPHQISPEDCLSRGSYVCLFLQFPIYHPRLCSEYAFQAMMLVSDLIDCHSPLRTNQIY